MTDCATLKKQAEGLFKQNQFAEAATLFEQLHIACADAWDEWAVWYYVRTLRKLDRSSDGIEVCRAFRAINPDSSRVNGQYGWCLYDVYIKTAGPDDSDQFFKAANEVVRVTQHEQYSPYEWIVFRVLSRLEDMANPNYGQILNWTDKIDPGQLSTEVKPAPESDTHNKSYPSPREHWYASRSKALSEVGRYQECIDVCTRALSEITEFHYDYDVWLHWRRALSYLNLEQAEAALVDLEAVHKVKKDFFVAQATARALVMRGDNERALGFAITAALAPGKAEFKWKLFMLIAQILDTLGNRDQARVHAVLAARAREVSEPTKDSPELQALLNHLGIEADDAPPVKTLMQQLQPFWESLKPLPDTAYSGKIDKIHTNGKSGNIRRDDGTSFFFGMRDFLSSKNECQPGQRVRFNLQEAVRHDTGAKEWHAVDIVTLGQN